MTDTITLTSEDLYRVLEDAPADTELWKLVSSIAESMERAGSDQVTVVTGWHPVNADRPDGSQILAAVQADGSIHVAERAATRDTWGPPLPISLGPPARPWAAALHDLGLPKVLDVGNQTALGESVAL